jgi:hypothetical protein
MEESNSKPKYIRKKCEHNKYSFQCKDCGIAICEHEKIKYICIKCNPNLLCKHSKRKNKCVECKGSSICEHNKRKTRCIECNGTSICEHKKIKSRCVDCKGSSICEHGKRKEYCTTCDGSSICEHNKRKSRCIDCNGSSICEHKKDKYTYVECHGNNICSHNKLRYQCIDCKGNKFCEHNKRRCLCEECDGIYLCEHKKQRNHCIICTPEIACKCCQAVSVIKSKWKPYCFRCFCILNPDYEIPRRYKLREHYVCDELKIYYKDTLTMIFDKIIENGCSRRRPDVFIDFGSHCVMIEVDENAHTNYTCEQKRMLDIYEDIGFRKIVFIRFNPDGYSTDTVKFESPFSYTKTGIVNVNKVEMKRRIDKLLAKIDYYKVNEPDNEFIIDYMFYGNKPNDFAENFYTNYTT